MTNLREIARVLRHREFRLLWLAQSASAVGDNIVLVALALFIIRTGSATDLGIVLAAQALPLVAFLLVGGVWADRVARHRVMVVTDLMRFALHALLAVLIFAGRVPIWQLVVIEMLFRGAEAFFRPAANGLLPQTWVWATLASFCVALFCGLAGWFVLGPVVAREQYGHIGVYGVIEAATGLGAIVGSFAGFFWRPRYPMRMAMLAMLLWPVAAIPYAVGVTLVVVVPLSVLAGAGFSLFNVWWLTALAERIPPSALSRVTSYDWMVSSRALSRERMSPTASSRELGGSIRATIRLH
jgi:MFS family permease